MTESSLREFLDSIILDRGTIVMDLRYLPAPKMDIDRYGLGFRSFQYKRSVAERFEGWTGALQGDGLLEEF